MLRSLIYVNPALNSAKNSEIAERLANLSANYKKITSATHIDVKDVLKLYPTIKVERF